MNVRHFLIPVLCAFTALVSVLLLSHAEAESMGGHWNCVKIEPKGWTRCTGSVTGYSGRVLLYFPEQSKPARRVYLHLHGFRVRNNEDSDFVRMMDGFELPRVAARAGMQDGVIVVPESRGRCDTYTSELQGSFERFYAALTNEIDSAIPIARSARITLSGHSGAFVPIQNIIRGNGSAASRIDRIVLLDATYSSIDTAAFSNWMSGDSKRSLYSGYLSGTGTQSGAQRLDTSLGAPHVEIEGLPRSTGHWGAVSARFGKILN